jgi:flagellar hook-length control protein FliK
MDFAADAVFDVAAPPSRPANARPAPTRDTSEPSFDDHLDAATAEEAPPEERAKPADNAKASDNTDKEPDAPAVQADAAPPTEPPAPPHIVQIVAPPPAPVASETTDANGAAPQIAPIEATPAPEAPAPAAPSAAPAASPPAEANSAENAVKTESPGSPSDAANSAAAAPAAQQSDAAEANTAAPQAPAPIQTSVATAQAPSPPPTTEAPPPDLATLSARPAPVEGQAPTPQRASKADTQRGAKSFEAVVEGGNGEAPSVNAAQTQKSAPAAATASKDAGSSLLALQADAPEIPAPTAQQSGTPLAQAAAQAQQAASIDHTAAVRATPAAAQIAREIVRRFDGDNTTFDLRLDPPELGRVEVRLDVSRDHRVTAVISADSPQALADLARNARELEQMLNDAGLQLSDSGLSFDLRQGSEGNADSGDTNSRGRSAESGDATQQQASTAARPLGFERWRGVRVDVTV